MLLIDIALQPWGLGRGERGGSRVGGHGGLHLHYHTGVAPVCGSQGLDDLGPVPQGLAQVPAVSVACP